MAEVAKNKKRGLGTGGGSKMVTENFMRQFRDSDSLELKKLSAAQFMEVWEHYDSDGKNISSWTHPEKKKNELEKARLAKKHICKNEPNSGNIFSREGSIFSKDNSWRIHNKSSRKPTLLFVTNCLWGIMVEQTENSISYRQWFHWGYRTRWFSTGICDLCERFGMRPWGNKSADKEQLQFWCPDKYNFLFCQVVSDSMLAELKQCFLEAYDDNRDGKIDIREVWKRQNAIFCVWGYICTCCKKKLYRLLDTAAITFIHQRRQRGQKKKYSCSPTFTTVR